MSNLVASIHSPAGSVPGKPAKVGIVILNYKNWQDTVECLESVETITYSEREIVVVDNDSRNQSLDHIRQWFEARQLPVASLSEGEIEKSADLIQKRILIQANSNRGYAAGNNLGIRAVLARGCDYVLILNNDTIPEQGFLEPLVEYAQTHPQVGMAGPRLVNLEGQIEATCARRRPTPGDYFFRLGLGRILFPGNRWIRRHFYIGEYDFDQPREVEILHGACLLIKAHVLRRIGLLDEHTFLCLEEAILHERLCCAGFSSVVVPVSCVIHKVGRSRSRTSSDFVRQAERDSLRYYLSHYRGFGRCAVALLMLASARPAELMPGWFSARLFRLRR